MSKYTGYPDIDLRSESELMADLTRMLDKHTASFISGEKLAKDPYARSLMLAFIRIFQVMQERLNKVPEKHFIAFLDMLAMKMKEPEPARAPISFFLTGGKDHKRWTLIPSGVRITGETPETPDPVIFETVEEIAVVLPRPDAAVSVTPSADSHTIHRDGLFHVEDNVIESFFDGERPLPHRLYIGEPSLAELLPGDQINLNIDFDAEVYSEPADLFLALKPALLVFHEESENFLPAQNFSINKFSANRAELQLTLRAPLVESPLSGEKVATEVDLQKEFSHESFEAANVWLALDCTIPENHIESIKNQNLKIAGMEMGYTIDAANETATPEPAMLNRSRLDLDKDFLPFGEKPKLNDAFYFACEEVFGKENIKVDVHFIKSTLIQDVFADNNPELIWEYFGEKGWEAIRVDPAQEHDPTSGLTTYSPVDGESYKQATLTFAVSPAQAPSAGTPSTGAFVKTKVNGKESLWIRCRLVGGDYGEEEKIRIEVDESGTYPVYNTITTAKTLAPPWLEKIEINYTSLNGTFQPSKFIVNNNYYHQDFTDELLRGNALSPFFTLYDKTPTLYLGFNHDYSGLPISLFISLVKQDKMSQMFLTRGQPPKIFWEYWANGWKNLRTDDRTNSMSKRDVVKFRGPEKVEPLPMFGKTRYWIRARMEHEEPSLKIKGEGIYNNVIWARQYVSISDEKLGSGNGFAGQKLSLKNKPVLQGEKIYVLEETFTDEEKFMYRRKHGEDSVLELYNSFTEKTDVWVRWFKVDHFYFSGPESRHYQIDRIAGEITFGNNIKGMIPPRGKNNIICKHYRYGGGKEGNLPSGAIQKLRSGIPYVNACVNFLPAFGGEKAEDMEALRRRGPGYLKSGDRAVTREDLAFMVKQASGSVAAVKALAVTDVSGAFHPGYITLLVLPHSDSEKPVLNNEIISDIEEYLEKRAVYHLVQTQKKQINLISPKYVTFSVHVKILEYTDPSLSLAAENEIQKNLAAYFHPITGGPKGTGWPFGRNVPVMEIYQMVEKVEAVSRIESIEIFPSLQQLLIPLNAPQLTRIKFPKHSGIEIAVEATLSSFFTKYRLRYYLPEEIGRGKTLKSVIAMGFKEGDHIQLKMITGEENEIKSDPLVISGIGKDYLEIESAYLPGEFAAGSLVETLDGKIASYLLEPVSGSNVTRLDIATIEKLDTTDFAVFRSQNLNEGATNLPQDLSRVKPGSYKLTLIHQYDKNIFLKSNFAPLAVSSEISLKGMSQVHLEENYLTCSGDHKAEQIFKEEI